MVLSRCSFGANSKICSLVLERVQPNELIPNSINITNRLNKISTHLNLFDEIEKLVKHFHLRLAVLN